MSLYVAGFEGTTNKGGYLKYLAHHDGDVPGIFSLVYPVGSFWAPSKIAKKATPFKIHTLLLSCSRGCLF